jgi:hypothetical protein
MASDRGLPHAADSSRRDARGADGAQGPDQGRRGDLCHTQRHRGTIDHSACSSSKGSLGALFLEVAAAWPADTIVLGSHGRKGYHRLLLGSVSDGVVRHALCSVAVIRGRHAISH